MIGGARDLSNVLDCKYIWLGFCIGLLYIYLTIPYPELIRKENFEQKKYFQRLNEN